MRRKSVLMLVVGLAVMPLVAAAAGAETELRMALAHAQMAAGTSSLAVAQVHLHHVINCLVGAKGAAFDAKAGNPCAGMGKGVLKDASKAQMPALQTALVSASGGVGAQQLEQAQTQAQAAAAALQGLLVTHNKPPVAEPGITAKRVTPLK